MFDHCIVRLDRAPLVDSLGHKKERAFKEPKKYSFFKFIFFLLCLSILVAFPIFIILQYDQDAKFYRHVDSEIEDLKHSLKNLTNLARDISSKNQPQCANIRNVQKVDCNPDRPSNQETCLKRGCCWQPISASKVLDPPGIPYCYYPKNYDGYKISSISFKNASTIIHLYRQTFSGFPNDIKDLILNLTEHSDALEIKITDANSARFESPYPKLIPPNLRQNVAPSNAKLYEVMLEANGLLVVKRAGTSSILFQTDLSQMVFADQFLQLTSTLPSHNIYGLSERVAHLHRSTNWTRFTFLNSDLAPIKNHALYGSQPFYMVLEDGGNATGVALINSNIMDVILQPAPAITFRPIGGIFHFLIIPGAAQKDNQITAPRDVSRKLAQWIGLPELPPYWSLGFHLCRFGYRTLNRTRYIWNLNRQASIPFDVQWNDIDYMDRQNDFTYDKEKYAGLPEFVDELHREGMRYVVMTDPGISNTYPKGTYPPYDDGLTYNIFVRNSTGQILIGKVWNPISTVFPDFTHPNATAYWTKQIANFYNSVKFDGLWIDMNEPSNFVDGSKQGCPSDSSLDHPFYLPGDQNPLYYKTLCMSAQHYLSSHYNVHNIYGIAEAHTTNLALRKTYGKRPFIITRANFLGQGHYSGHWSGDIFSTFYDMQMTIPTILSYNMVGVPMIGADICGFNGNTTKELCARWSALGAFYPFSRNHNTDDTIDQDPASMGENVTQAARMALMTRYLILPYLYSQFVRAHLDGEPLARALFMEFPSDPTTYDIDTQFLLGPAFLVNPALFEGQTKVKAYFPAGTWYDFYSFSRLISGSAQWLTMDAPIYQINLATRGGYIMPLQNPNSTTTLSRYNPFRLLIPLDAQTLQAQGELFWDDGESLGTYTSPDGAYNHITFKVENNTLSITPSKVGYKSASMLLDDALVLGVESKPSRVEVNHKVVDFKYINLNKCLLITCQFDLKNGGVVEWFFD